jgi:hypothetical protein
LILHDKRLLDIVEKYDLYGLGVEIKQELKDDLRKKFLEHQEEIQN